MGTFQVEKFLEQNCCFESPDGTHAKELALEELERIFRHWITHNLSGKNTAEESQSLFFTLGSYKLKTHAPGADVDVLLVVSNQVSHDDVFSNFYAQLCRDHGHDISWSRKIENTFVPVIKMRYRGIDCDIAVSQLPTTDVNVDILDDRILKDMSIQSIRSLNGYRDCVKIMNLAERLNKSHEFRTVLMAVKMWASRRGLYNNSVGYFSGMGLMVLVARLIQANSELLTGSLSYLKQFFITYANWPWPRPVKLGYIEANHNDAPILQVWNPSVHRFEKEDKMPIITPAYPQRNSAFTVSNSTRRVIISELKRGAEICATEETALDALFSPAEFFQELKFSYYIILRASSLDKDDNHWNWCAIARSQIRKLLQELDSFDWIDRVHAFPNAYPTAHLETEQDGEVLYRSQWFIGVDIKPTAKCNHFDEINEILRKFEENVAQYAQEHGVDISTSSADGIITERCDLQNFLPRGIGFGVSGFTKLVEAKKGFFRN